MAKSKKYNVNIKYLSAPNYKIDVISNEYKTAEKIINEVTNEAISLIKKSGGSGEFKR